MSQHCCLTCFHQYLYAAIAKGKGIKLTVVTSYTWWDGRGVQRNCHTYRSHINTALSLFPKKMACAKIHIPSCRDIRTCLRLLGTLTFFLPICNPLKKTYSYEWRFERIHIRCQCVLRWIGEYTYLKPFVKLKLVCFQKGICIGDFDSLYLNYRKYINKTRVLSQFWFLI